MKRMSTIQTYKSFALCLIWNSNSNLHFIISKAFKTFWCLSKSLNFAYWIVFWHDFRSLFSNQYTIVILTGHFIWNFTPIKAHTFRNSSSGTVAIECDCLTTVITYYFEGALSIRRIIVVYDLVRFTNCYGIIIWMSMKWFLWWIDLICLKCQFQNYVLQTSTSFQCAFSFGWLKSTSVCNSMSQSQ